MCNLCLPGRSVAQSISDNLELFREDIPWTVPRETFFELPSTIYADNGPATGKSSFDYDTAAAQISRGNDKWDDDDVTTGAGNPYNVNGLGSRGTVTYGYIANAQIASLNPDEPARQMTSSEIAMVEYAIDQWEEVTNIEFMRVQNGSSAYAATPGSVEISIAALSNSNGGYTAYGALGGEILGADVFIGQDDLEVFGSYAMLTAIHELGHAIGLDHPSDYNGQSAFNYATEASYFEDSVQYTVMSYWDGFETGANYDVPVGNIDTRAPDTLMLHDIAAIQRLYGQNSATRSTDSTYGFNSNTGHQVWTVDDAQDQILGAIWDAGGFDVIDVSGYSDNQEVDLREASFSSVGGMTFNLAIAAGVKIEGVLGGSGNDTLIGNAADPSHYDAVELDINGQPLGSAVQGYDGANLLDGGDGDDVLMGDGEVDVAALLASLGL